MSPNIKNHLDGDAPTPEIQYVYNASITWNWARHVINSNIDIRDFYFFISRCKGAAKLKNRILMSKKWAILVNGISTWTSWCYLDFYEIHLKV